MDKFTRAALTTALITLASAPAFATNGYFTNGSNPQSKALAGASVAVESGADGLSANPAMATTTGRQAEACLSLFAPTRSTTFGPVEATSGNELFPIPCLGVNFMLPNGGAWGVEVFANGGLNTEYDTNFFGGSAPLGVNLEQLFVSVHYARDLGQGVTIGVAPVFAFQRFEATGLEPFAGMSSDPAAVTNNGTSTSTGFGANLGVVFRPDDRWTFGAAYRTKIDMSEFSDYAGLFAGGGDFDIPATATLGVAFRPAADGPLTVTGEVQRIFYGDIPAIANSLVTATGPLGAADGPGFGWKDMDVVRLGAIYEASDRLTLRGGVSYATAFADSQDVLLNTLSPATPQWHVGIGASYDLTENWQINGSYVRVFEEELTGNSGPAFGNQDVAIRMDQHELSVGATYRW